MIRAVSLRKACYREAMGSGLGPANNSKEKHGDESEREAAAAAAAAAALLAGITRKVPLPSS